MLVAGFIDDFLVFLVPDIADALEEQQRKDVGLEVSRTDWAAQDVGGFPKMAFELGWGDVEQRVVRCLAAFFVFTVAEEVSCKLCWRA